GNPLALQAFDKAARVLGQALANIACITAPTHIFVFGGVAQVGEILLAPLRKYFAENLLFCYKKTAEEHPAVHAEEHPAVCIELSELMETFKDAAILGAAALARL
ncbi:MAG: ROK family protein, partial [Bacteroidales bacterium]|nr:ROK family protein [Bacteroidales bacterium]